MKSWVCLMTRGWSNYMGNYLRSKYYIIKMWKLCFSSFIIVFIKFKFFENKRIMKKINNLKNIKF